MCLESSSILDEIVLIDERGVDITGAVVLCCSTRQDSFHASKLQGQSMFKVCYFSTAYVLFAYLLSSNYGIYSFVIFCKFQSDSAFSGSITAGPVSRMAFTPASVLQYSALQELHVALITMRFDTGE